MDAARYDFRSRSAVLRRGIDGSRMDQRKKLNCQRSIRLFLRLLIESTCEGSRWYMRVLLHPSSRLQWECVLDGWPCTDARTIQRAQRPIQRAQPTNTDPSSTTTDFTHPVQWESTLRVDFHRPWMGLDGSKSTNNRRSIQAFHFHRAPG